MPTVGCGGVAGWEITATGTTFHSGMPHKATNALELAKDAVSFIQSKFYAKFPPHKDEPTYNFECSSSLKPTQCSCPGQLSFNQIPGKCVISGDIRLVPFYDILDAMKLVQDCVKEMNSSNFAILPRTRDLWW